MGASCFVRDNGSKVFRDLISAMRTGHILQAAPVREAEFFFASGANDLQFHRRSRNRAVRLLIPRLGPNDKGDVKVIYCELATGLNFG